MVDRYKLPDVALIDTNVLIPFLGRKPKDDRERACVEFCDAMVDNNCRILIAAFSVAEVARKKGEPVPRTMGMLVVPFDRAAGEMLGVKLQQAALIELRDGESAPGFPLGYWQYDALILACAIRWGAHALITMDGPLTSLARRVGFRVAHPIQFRETASVPSRGAPRQATLPFDEAHAEATNAAARVAPPSPATDGTAGLPGDMGATTAQGEAAGEPRGSEPGTREEQE